MHTEKIWIYDTCTFYCNVLHFLFSLDSNHHGTRCAGEIAAVPNSYCAVGVAFGAKFAGIFNVFTVWLNSIDD